MKLKRISCSTSLTNGRPVWGVRVSAGPVALVAAFGAGLFAVGRAPAAMPREPEPAQREQRGVPGVPLRGDVRQARPRRVRRLRGRRDPGAGGNRHGHQRHRHFGDRLLFKDFLFPLGLRGFGGCRCGSGLALDQGKDDLLPGAQGVGVGHRRVELQEEVHVLAEDQVRGHALSLQDFDQGVAALDHVGFLLVGVGGDVRHRAGLLRGRGRDAFGDADDLAGLDAAEVRDVGVEGLDARHDPLDLRSGIALVLQDLEEPFALLDRVFLCDYVLDVDVLLEKEA